MGTVLSIRELASQWRTIVIALVGIIELIALTMTLGAQLFGFQTAVIAIITYVMQGFVVYPLTAMMLKKEGRKLLKGLRLGELTISKEDVKVDIYERKKLIPPLPKNYQTTYVILAKLGLVAWTSVGFAELIKPFVDISPFVMYLFFGVIAQEIGLPKMLVGGFTTVTIVSVIVAGIFINYLK